MNPEFSPIDVQTIKALLSSKTDQEIADIIEMPVEAVHEKIQELTSGPEERIEQLHLIEESRTREEQKRKKPANIKSRQEKDRERKLAEKKKEQTAANLREAERIRRGRVREKAQRFETRQIKLSELVSVKIDRRTTVFVKPGTDIEKIKKQYTKYEA